MTNFLARGVDAFAIGQVFGGWQNTFAGEARRQVRGFDHRSCTEHNRMLDRIGQFTNVTGPFVGDRRSQRFLADLCDMALARSRKAAQEKICEG
jgi:hypothetical protein